MQTVFKHSGTNLTACQLSFVRLHEHTGIRAAPQPVPTVLLCAGVNIESVVLWCKNRIWAVCHRKKVYLKIKLYPSYLSQTENKALSLRYSPFAAWTTVITTLVFHSQLQTKLRLKKQRLTHVKVAFFSPPFYLFLQWRHSMLRLTETYMKKCFCCSFQEQSRFSLETNQVIIWSTACFK